MNFLGPHYYLMIPIAFVQGWGQLTVLQNSFGGVPVISGIGFTGGNAISTLSILLAMTAGTAILVWMGELVTEKGIGNGVSLIIFAGIVSSIPQLLGQGLLLRNQTFQLILLVVIVLMASVQEICVNFPSPLLPTLFKGYFSLSG